MANLRKQDFTVYCPKIIKRVNHARRSADELRALFPQYVFILQPPPEQRWRLILGTQGIRSLVCLGGQKPATVPGEFIVSLKAREVDGVIRKPDTPFQSGQTAAVSGGVFD